MDAEVHFDNRLNNIAVNDDYPDDIGLKLGRASKYHGALKGLWKGLLPSQVVYGLAEMSKDAQLLSKDAQSLSKDAQSLSKDAQSLSKDAQSLSEDAQSLSEDAQSLSEDAQSLSEDAQSLSEDAQSLSEDAHEKRVPARSDSS